MVQQNVQNMAYCVSYLFSFCPKNPLERLYVDPPTMLSSRFFYQRIRFGELDFGRYREFLVSVRVVADLGGRVGCWKYFLFKILQKVLLQLHWLLQSKILSWHCRCRTCFCGLLSAHADRRPWRLLPCFFKDFTEMMKLPKIPFGIGLCSFLFFFFFPTTFLEIAVDDFTGDCSRKILGRKLSRSLSSCVSFNSRNEHRATNFPASSYYHFVYIKMKCPVGLNLKKNLIKQLIHSPLLDTSRYSQLGASCLVGYLPPRIQRGLIE